MQLAFELIVYALVFTIRRGKSWLRFFGRGHKCTSSRTATRTTRSCYGRMIGACGVPTLLVVEGGYTVAEIGVNVVNVLTGFEDS
jgi:hypothetical protein